MFSIFGRMSALLGSIPYSLVALYLRVVVAWTFFSLGQEKVDGAKIGTDLLGYEISFKLPSSLLETTFLLAANDYKLPLIPSPWVAYVVSYAEHLLPVLILLGLATRLSSFVLLVMVLVAQVFIFPNLWWSLHAYWIGLLLVLMTRGAGHISLDGFFGLFRRKPKPLPRFAPEAQQPAAVLG